jgi:hypothetical protein
MGIVLGALICAGATTGCRILTIPWEHPTAFKKQPACDSPGPCGNGCNVPPPPMLDSDCYGYRFTCWHPWPEHCQPQCQDGCEQTYMTVAPQPAQTMPEHATPSETVPTMPPDAAPAMPPVTPPTVPPEETSYAPPSSATTQYGSHSRGARENEYREPPSYARYAPARREVAPPAGNWSRGASSPPTNAPTDNATEAGGANYGFLSAVAQSNGAIRDESVRPASRVTRLYEPGTGPDNPQPTEGNLPRNGAQRFQW